MRQLQSFYLTCSWSCYLLVRAQLLSQGYTCGTIYVDHCSTFLFIRHQLTTAASNTIRGKMLLESEAADIGVTIK